MRPCLCFCRCVVFFSGEGYVTIQAGSRADCISSWGILDTLAQFNLAYRKYLSRGQQPGYKLVEGILTLGEGLDWVPLNTFISGPLWPLFPFILEAKMTHMLV